MIPLVQSHHKIRLDPCLSLPKACGPIIHFNDKKFINANLSSLSYKLKSWSYLAWTDRSGVPDCSLSGLSAPFWTTPPPNSPPSLCARIPSRPPSSTRRRASRKSPPVTSQPLWFSQLNHFKFIGDYYRNTKEKSYKLTLT